MRDRAYVVLAAKGTGIMLVGTTDTASEALIKLADALNQHAFAWAEDEPGFEISPAELRARSYEEQERH